MSIVSETIARCLKGSKRLIIPTLGAFLRKDGDGRIVFVEFLKKDDEVLMGELSRTYRLSMPEAGAAVDSFIAMLRKQAASSDGFIIEGVGTMRADSSGVLDLEYDPQVKAAAPVPNHTNPIREELLTETAVPKEPRTPMPAPSALQPDKDNTKEDAALRPARPTISVGVARGTQDEEHIQQDTQQQTTAQSVQKPQIEPEQALENEPARAQTVPSPQKPDSAEQRSAPNQQTPTQPANTSEQTTQRTVTPSPSVDDLWEDEATPGQSFETDKLRYQKPVRPMPDSRKRRADIIMIVAIVAATIAITAMIYGVMSEKTTAIRPPDNSEQVAPAESQNGNETQGNGDGSTQTAPAAPKPAGEAGQAAKPQQAQVKPTTPNPAAKPTDKPAVKPAAKPKPTAKPAKK